MQLMALDDPSDWEAWKAQARALIHADVPPDAVLWQSAAERTRDLFADNPVAHVATTAPSSPPKSLRVPRLFSDLAAKAILHSDPTRHALLYRILFRLQASPTLMHDAADDDVARLHLLARAVRRDIHKMRAFVRFRLVTGDSAGQQPDDGGRYVAWFEPEHHIVRANADFFVNRFANMRWAILTPKGSMEWDGAALIYGPPASRADAPTHDDTEAMWKTYFASIFNPARLKVGAMVKEMPKRYWKNLPEAAIIPDLIAGAQAREAQMVEQGGALFDEAPPESLDHIAAGIAACRRCPIGCNGTRAVAGTGHPDAPLMIIGEQPGDHEEQAGRPFVGPAGQLLRAHLDKAGISMHHVWMTNAVKHFKHETRPPQKRRLHQNPTAREIDICRWWVESERRLVAPQIVLALGASAARSVLGKTVSVQAMRGQPLALPDGATLYVTTHPSYLLRIDDTSRPMAEQAFAEDLRLVRAAMGADLL